MKMPEVSHTPQADRKHGESEVTIEFFKGNMVNIERLTVEQAKALYQSLADFLAGAPEPEWEREYRRVRLDGVPVFNAVFETMPLLDDDYTAEYRTVSQWLPVEGENK